MRVVLPHQVFKFDVVELQTIQVVLLWAREGALGRVSVLDVRFEERLDHVQIGVDDHEPGIDFRSDRGKSGFPFLCIGEHLCRQIFSVICRSLYKRLLRIEQPHAGARFLGFHHT